MFELSVACKYLIPRRRQLSVSIISLISILVIALVVWLVVVFFSVTNGLEKNWVEKLTALTAPVRITPTDAYYHSYYYLIDSISDASNYALKTIREKKEAETSDPYDPSLDEEIPPTWMAPDRYSDGSLKDLVKLVYGALDKIPGVSGLYGQDFELTATHIQLRLLRHSTVLHANNLYGGKSQSILSYPAYLGNFEPNNSSLKKTLLPIEQEDLSNLLALLERAPQENMEDLPSEKELIKKDIFQNRLKKFFDFVEIQELQTRPSGWNIPKKLFPSGTVLDVLAILRDGEVIRLIAPQQKESLLSLRKSLEEQGLTLTPGKVEIQEGDFLVMLENNSPKSLIKVPLTLAGGSSFSAKLDPSSIQRAKRVDHLTFEAEIPLQGLALKGFIPYRGLKIAKAKISSPNDYPYWIEKETPFLELPKDPEMGEGILLPKSFRKSGVLVGDSGSLSYLSPTPSMLQEQQIPIYVAGFYDPGIIPIGGKFILASREVTSLIRASHNQEDKTALTNGINVRFDHFQKAFFVKEQIEKGLQEQGISRYWNVETYQEYEFTKEMMRELQNQKNLFMFIAVVIILVACSNIISMLIILVNDKKTEIGILRSMGATSQNIAFIFGLCGAIIGVLGSIIGIGAAILTLHYLNPLVQLISKLQGQDLFSANLYGEILPHELSFEALSFVLIATVCLSLFAGIVPAIKACLLRPSQILRSGGN